jgi:putative transposase
LPQHVVVRGNDRSDIFFCDDDRLAFLKLLGEARRERECEIHAFVLMRNHVHLLATGVAPFAISRMMQDIGRAYVKRINSRYERTGTLYEGRFKSSLVESHSYFLACMRYVEMNPVRAGLASHPSTFPWSSFGQNASGEPSGLITPHAEYLGLGRDAPARRRAYLQLFDVGASEQEVAAIRECAQQGRALGSDQFCKALEGTLLRSVRVVPQGRPARRP